MEQKMRLSNYNYYVVVFKSMCGTIRDVALVTRAEFHGGEYIAICLDGFTQRNTLFNLRSRTLEELVDRVIKPKDGLSPGKVYEFETTAKMVEFLHNNLTPITNETQTT